MGTHRRKMIEKLNSFKVFQPQSTLTHTGGSIYYHPASSVSNSQSILTSTHLNPI